MRDSSIRLAKVVSNAMSRRAAASVSSLASVRLPASITETPSSFAITSALTNSSTRRGPLNTRGAEVDLPAPFGPARMKRLGIRNINELPCP